MAEPTGQRLRLDEGNKQLLFGADQDETSHFSTYAIYGGALPLAVMIVALGVFTYYGYKPLGPLLTHHTYRMSVAGGLMGGGALSILAIAYRYHKTLGFTSLERLEAMAPRQIKVIEDGVIKTKTVTPDLLKKEYFLRVKDQEAFILPTLQGKISYMHVRDGFYFKVNEDDRKYTLAGASTYDGIAYAEINSCNLEERANKPIERKCIDPVKHLIQRLEADQAVFFKGKYYNHAGAGFYTVSDTPIFQITTLHELLGKDPYINRVARKPDLKKGLLPRLKDGQSLCFEGKTYVHIHSGNYYVINSTQTGVSLPKLIEQVAPLNRKLHEIDLKKDLLPRMEDGESLAFKGNHYEMVQGGMWIESQMPKGDSVTLHTLLKREKKQKLTNLPTLDQTMSKIQHLGPNECIFYQDNHTAMVYGRLSFVKTPSDSCSDRGSIESAWFYRGKERDYRTVSLKDLKAKKRAPSSDIHPGGRGLDGAEDRRRIEKANAKLESERLELDSGDSTDDEFYEASEKPSSVSFDDD